MRYSIIIVALVLFAGCKKTVSTAAGINGCMQVQIDSALSLPRGNLWYSIDAYEYNGATVYLYYAGCCDRYNELKDANCNYMFAPSGGFTGGGDHSHPNFFKDAKFIRQVWIDPRP